LISGGCRQKRDTRWLIDRRSLTSWSMWNNGVMQL